MAWKRQRSISSDVSRALSISDLREMARRRLPGFVFEYLEGGAEDEMTLENNRRSLAALRLIPRTLVDTSRRDQRVGLFDRSSAAPLVIAPTGLNGMLCARGDIVLAQAAAKMGIPYTLSTVSNSKLEEVAKQAAGRLWMQLYITKHRQMSEYIINRAKEANYETLVVTTDANVFGNREWDRRNYRRPGKLSLRSTVDALRHPGWAFSVLGRNGLPRFCNLEPLLPAGFTSVIGGSTVLPKLLLPTITWSDVKWIRSLWPGKLVLKGVLTAEDALQALDTGCDGIVVSNHGGRQLDHCVSPIEVLPQIVQAAGRHLTIIVDSGFRRGTDIVKALALGANAVMIGRAVLYGLAGGGEAGVRQALTILSAEIDRVLGQLGCCSISELGPQHLRAA